MDQVLIQLVMDAQGEVSLEYLATWCDAWACCPRSPIDPPRWDPVMRKKR